MNVKKSKKWIALVSAIAVIILILAVIGLRSGTKNETNAVPKGTSVSYEESYRGYLEKNGYEGVLSQSEINVDISKYSVSADMIANKGEEGILTEDNGIITWEFQAAESGFYNLELGYITLPGTTSDIQRKIYIDGELPYEALSQVVINRWWQDGEIKVKNNNEIRPEANEVYFHTTWFVEDYQRRNNEPLMIYLEKGKHTISFEVIKEPLEYTSKLMVCFPFSR